MDVENKTVSEKKQDFMRYQSEFNGIDNFANKGMSDAINALRDMAVNRRMRSTGTFDKETLRQFLQNIGNNEKNLRDLSRFLAYRSQVYYRLIVYLATMLTMDARTIIPHFDLTKKPSKNDVLRNYQDNLVVFDRLNLKYEMLKAALVCWREDVFYGVNYYDETGHFIFQLDPDYCKINGVYSYGDFAYCMDMTYFRGKETLLELFGEPFVSMYKAYDGNNEFRWQQMPDEYCVCFKIRAEDWETVVPPFIGIFNSLINLSDLEDIEAIADEQVIYKLLWLELETLSNTDMPDDWKVNPEIVKRYYNKMINEAIPDYATATISPVPIHEISFPSDAASDTTKVQKATESVLNTSGGAQILNSASISGAEAFRAAIKADTKFALSSLLPQIEAWVNRFMSYQVKNPCKVKFFEVSIYTKEEFRSNLLQDCQYGLPNKLALNALNGYSELETMSMNYLEEDCLNLSEVFVPLQSTHTQSGSNSENVGRPKDEQQTTDGEASEDKRDRSNG